MGPPVAILDSLGMLSIVKIWILVLVLTVIYSLKPISCNEVESAEEKDSTEDGVNSALWFPNRLFKREAETNTGYQPWLGRKKRNDPEAFSDDKNYEDYIFKRNQYQWSRMKKNSQYQWSRMRRSPYLWNRIRKNTYQPETHERTCILWS